MSPSSWESTTLSDARTFALLSGLWKGKKPPFTRATVVRNTNFAERATLDMSDVAVLDVEERQLADRRLHDGDIIIERSGGGPKQPVGRPAYFPHANGEPFSFSNFTSVVRVIDRESYFPIFVAYYLLHLYQAGETVPLQRATTGIRNLDWSAYTQLPVARPPVGEQKRIAAVLSLVQRAIANEEKALAMTRELKRAALAQVFARGLRDEASRESEIGTVPATWDVRPMAELRKFLQYGTSERCDYAPIGHPVLRIPNVADGRIDWSDLKRCVLDEEIAASLRLERGDILVIRTNGVRERVGTCAVYDGEPPDALFASYLIRARPTPDLNPHFFQYYTETRVGASFLAGRASPASDGKFNVNTKTIDSVLVPTPPRAEQDEIVAVLSTIDVALRNRERCHVALSELFASLLNSLMTGEIRVDELEIDISEIEAA